MNYTQPSFILDSLHHDSLIRILFDVHHTVFESAQRGNWWLFLRWNSLLPLSPPPENSLKDVFFQITHLADVLRNLPSYAGQSFSIPILSNPIRQKKSQKGNLNVYWIKCQLGGMEKKVWSRLIKSVCNAELERTPAFLTKIPRFSNVCGGSRNSELITELSPISLFSVILI